MRGRGGFRVLRFVLIALVVAAVLSLAVMGLWNWLMPALFGLKAIGFWQALGLVVLSKILFGGFRGGPMGGPAQLWRWRIADRWEQMTPEERVKFKEGMRGWCHRGSRP